MLISPLPAAPIPPDAAALRSKAVEMEAVFLSEMLAHAGLDQGLSPGAEAGETDPFASFLRDRMAEQIARRGGIGLSEAIFRSLAAEADHAGNG